MEKWENYAMQPKYNYYPNMINNLNNFYKRMGIINFNEIAKERINEIRNSKELQIYYDFYNGHYIKNYNPYILPKSMKIDMPKNIKYFKIINQIDVNPTLNLKNSLEKCIFFVSIIDPNFDALIIYYSCNKTDEIKKQMENKFGVFDKNLIKIEKKLYKKLLNIEQINNLKEEIDKATYK